MIKPFDEKCTGCNACLTKCPRGAIHLERAELGFYYPVIDDSSCVNCGACDGVCPIDKELADGNGQKAYAAVHIESEILNNSTSGGVFSAIASWVLSRGGAVYGCAYDDELRPVHIRIDSAEDLYKLRGSKYVQSYTNGTYAEAERDLKDGKYVLYSGTPCQVDGLRHYLGKNYERLVCVDLVCHGVPSADYFADCVRYLEKKTGGKIDTFFFRQKKNNRSMLSGTYSGTYTGTYTESDKRFTRKLNHFDNYYYSYFLNGETYRSSCYTCKYAQISRVGDFTIGDLWGAEGLELPFDVKNGCSLVLLNTDIAHRLWSELDELQSKEIAIDRAMKYNAQLQRPSEYKQSRAQRADEYEKHDGAWIQKNFERKNFRRNMIGRIKYATPKSLKNLLLKLRYRSK